ncbi:hypothetical protein OPIT5_13935 [Opitutaceae bacterium TAV5]|nr:hypothetical protein OPIT5_13935 [Opitutaceae bacterium TAV5]
MKKISSVALRLVRLCCVCGGSFLFGSGCGKEAPRPESVVAGTSVEIPEADSVHVPVRRADWRWQNESHFVVDSVVGEIASTLAALRDPERVSAVPVTVDVRERLPAEGEPLTYDVTITPGWPDGPGPWSGTLAVTGAIWDPAMYAQMARAFAAHTGVALPSADAPAPEIDARADTAFAKALAEADGPALERINRLISAQMKENLRAASIHDRAVLLLAVFALRDAAGDFTSIAPTLDRMAAQLTLAEVLGGDVTEASEAHRFANAALATLVNDQRRALALLDELEPAEGLAWAAWKRALRTRITGDYRIAPPAGQELLLLERRERYRAYAQRVDGERAWAIWEQFPERWKSMPDWFRIVRGQGTGVAIGHVLLDTGLALEENEIRTVYSLSTRGAEPAADGSRREQRTGDDAWVAALNTPPGPLIRAAVKEPGGFALRIIDWGLWADQLQRHLCHTIKGDHHFLMRQWSVPDYAEKYRSRADALFGRLRLYAFAQRENAVDQAGFDQAQKDVIVKMQATPELVPPAFWSLVRYQVRRMPLHDFMPADDIAAWRRHSPLPGTAYDPQPAYARFALDHRSDQPAVFDDLLARAPYDAGIVKRVLYFRYKENIPESAAEKLYGPVLDYDAGAVACLVKITEKDPGKNIVWLEKAAKLDPFYFYKLAEYWVAQGDAAKAEDFYEKAFAQNADSVQAANKSFWLVNRYEDTGRSAQATRLADQAGQTWSHRGLETRAWLHERREEYGQAMKFYEAIHERYDSPEPLVAAALRIRAKTGDASWAERYARIIREMSPQDPEPVTVASLGSDPPVVGMRFTGDSELLRSSGLLPTDIVVAVRGYRVWGHISYSLLRDTEFGKPIALIVWRDGAYREVVAPAVPNNLFGVGIADYKAAR